ncbi:hypothetical protein D3C87_1819830 [compost metagenome]
MKTAKLASRAVGLSVGRMASAQSISLPKPGPPVKARGMPPAMQAAAVERLWASADRKTAPRMPAQSVAATAGSPNGRIQSVKSTSSDASADRSAAASGAPLMPNTAIGPLGSQLTDGDALGSGRRPI